MISNLKSLEISKLDTVRAALSRLESTAVGILLIVDGSGRLERTVTDGDLRRLLLTGSSLDDHLSDLPDRGSVTGTLNTSESEAFSIMHKHRIRHLPIIDEGGRVTRIFRTTDFDQPVLLSSPHMGNEELQFVAEAFDSNWIAPLGPNVDAFERELATYVGVGHAAALNSGTAAIHLALVLLGIKRGDEVFCSSLTFVGSVNPIMYQGATPVFIDSEPESWNMSPRALERAFLKASRDQKLPKAVIVVNLYGQNADMDSINAICNRFGVPVVEDAAESLGATYKGKASGSLGTLGIYSFNGNKIITTSGGGMLVSNDEELVVRGRFLAAQARERAPYYLHKEIGFNYRMSNILAGVGRGQLRVLDKRIARRRQIFDRYRTELSDVNGLTWMPEAYGRSTRWLSCALLDSGVNAKSLIVSMEKRRIEARHIWRPLHLQPVFAGFPYFAYEKNKSVSDNLFERGICFPSGSNMTDADQDRVIDAIRKALL